MRSLKSKEHLLKKIINCAQRSLLALTMSFGLFAGSSIIAETSAKAGTYSIAKRYIGLHERKHTGKLKKYIGVNPRSTPWCGAFMATVSKRAGKAVPAGHLRAANWKRVGKGISLKNARKGDIVVIRTKRGHHVGFYAGRKDGRVQVLGGNQSNMVKVSNFRVGSVQSVRRY